MSALLHWALLAAALTLALPGEAQDFRRYDPTNVAITGGTITGVTISGGTVGATIGGVLTGGTAGRVLFVGAGPVLADDAGLTYDSATDILSTTAVRVGVAGDVYLSRYDAKKLMISGDGVGATTNAGWICGYFGTTGQSGCWPSTVTPSSTNHTLFSDGTNTYVNAAAGGILGLTVNGGTKFTINGSSGSGPSIIAGTTADNTNRALSISQTWTDGTSSNIGIVGNFDMGATGTATGKLLSLQAGAAGTTEVYSVNQKGTPQAHSYSFLGTAGVVGDVSTGFFILGTGAIGVATGGAQTISLNGNNGGGIILSGTNTLSFTSIAIAGTAPTLASGGCTSPTAVTANGTARFSVGVGTSCSGSQPLVFTLPAATTGWACTAQNSSNAATSAPAQSSAISTTSVTITNYSRTLGTAAAWTDADVVVVKCLGG